MAKRPQEGSKKDKRRKPEEDAARLTRPEKEVKDLDAPPEDADDVRGGYAKISIDYSK